MLVTEPEPATTMPVSSANFVNENRELARELWQAHRELTDWISFYSLSSAKSISY